MNKTKSFAISKQMVFKAYNQVVANRGAAGIDNISIEQFQEKLSKNLYKIWNRLSSGSYFPPSVKAVEIPKKNGGTRVLGVPTVADRIAQMVVRNSFEPKAEKHFLPDSYGYRPRRSAHDALAVTRKRCWQMNWVLEFDIKGLFDNIDHELLMKAVTKHTDCKWELLYIKRWLTAPFEKKNGEIVPRNSGVPQGGVISPVLANLFLHYTFDKWMVINFPNNPWCRYADDGIVHCKSKEQAEYIRISLEKRLEQCKLAMHPDKTKIVYCKDSNRKGNHENIQFTFLGYTYKPRKAKGQNGTVFTSFLPAISKKAKEHIRQTIKSWRLLWMTNKSLVDIAWQYNPVIRGWLNYYGKYGKKELTKVLEHINLHLSLWIRRKYKKYKTKPTQARQLLSYIATKERNLFAHWKVGIT
ncbi:group II intron reverse transcriptase/maturase [Heliorestis acidaminivorans]|uniref:RNA-directed DNA polymerase n=1 Tax=Heliorestis acidaminivorans TaxID=553427 RepID=A0A6I0EYV4_9FIRM|nr:group II intron reverse transcriptase/maturase [Heliorestis acidaminivorans]KAB2950686.1 group II intron reverse transcriptase/maturase [Heliorestis acidaminivorans]